MNKRSILFLGVIGIVLVLMVNPLLDVIKYDKEEMYCEVEYCSKTTLDEFDECIDLGRESSGFLSSNHFYLCDGFKITSKCIERGTKELDTKTIFGGYGRMMVCEKVAKGRKRE